MPPLDRTQSVSSLALAHPECAPVLDGYRIDYCCRGRASLSDAATQRSLDPERVIADLERAIELRAASGVPERDPHALLTSDLVSHIITRYHLPLRTALPWLDRASAKVARVHGDRDERLVALGDAVATLVRTLGPHLDDEERTLFPMMVRGEPCDELAAAVRHMEDEHEAVGALLAELRTLETEVHRHVSIENHVLAERFRR